VKYGKDVCELAGRTAAEPTGEIFDEISGDFTRPDVDTDSRR